MSTRTSADAALAGVQAAAVRAREALSRAPPSAPTEVLAVRLGAAASSLASLAGAIPEGLRFVAAAPVAVPAAASHVPEFLRTRKEPEQDAADARAEDAGRGLDALAYNAAAKGLLEACSAAASAALDDMQRACTEALQAVRARPTAEAPAAVSATPGG
jgi:hypothetical protein